MAERRMFAKSIVLSDAFLDMPATARCLYFTLSMFADDDGFIGSPRAIMRQCMATDDDMKLLLAKRFVLGFETGVIVIKHWRINNYLQNDRYKETTYLEEKQTLTYDGKGAYIEAEQTPCIQSVYKTDTQVSIGKDSIGKVSIESNRFKPPTLDEVKAYIEENHYNVDAERFINFYESKGWMVGKNKMKDWKAGVRNWNASEPSKKKGSFDTDDFFQASLNRTRRDFNADA